MSAHRIFILAAAGALCAAPVSSAAPANAAQNRPEPPAKVAAGNGAPVLVELFLSQACNRCPAAAALLPEIAARDGVVALSWHVDYWNMTDSPNGQWADPFSSPEYTKRQKRYNANIRKRGSVYTPQMVVDGASETVGSSDEKISALITDAAQNRNAAPVVAERRDGSLQFTVGASADGGNAYLVTFKKTATTNITSGANAGEAFNEVNVVTGMQRLGVVRRIGAELTINVPKSGEGCALIVQAPKQKNIVAAAYCPV